MARWSQSKNKSTIKINPVGIGIDKDVALLLASALISSITDNDQGSSAGYCHTDSDNTHYYTPIRMVNMEDVICHEAEETVRTNFLQSALDDTEDARTEDLSTIHCNHISIGTFITKNEEPLALCADTRAPKSVFGKKQVKRILDK